MIAMTAAMATVGRHNKEWDSDNALMTMIPLTITKMTRTTKKKEGDGLLHPPGDAAQEDWWRTSANGHGQWQRWGIG
jgi:hypothetical protein